MLGLSGTLIFHINNKSKRFRLIPFSGTRSIFMGEFFLVYITNYIPYTVYSIHVWTNEYNRKILINVSINRNIIV